MAAPTDTSQLEIGTANALVAAYNANVAANAAIMAELQAILTSNQSWQIKPQADGTLNSNFPGGAPPPPPSPAIATIPNYTNKSAPFSVDLSGFISGGAYTSASISGSLPSGWTFTGTVLAYSGSGTGSASVQLSLAWTGGDNILSNAFTVQSVAAVAVDTAAPSIPTGVSVTQAANVVSVVYNPASDPAPPGIGWSGMKQYVRTRSPAGGSFTGTVPAASLGVDFFPTPQDIGVPATPGTTVQTLTTFTMTGYGAGYYGTADQGQIAPFAVTGNFIVTFEVSAFVCANLYAKCGVDARAAIDPVNGPGCPHAFANIKPLAGGLGGVIDYRSAQGGTTTNTAQVAGVTPSVPLWVMFSRVGNLFTMWQSTNPNALGTPAAQCGQITVALPAQVYVGPVCAANGLGAAASCTINQWNITQDAQISFTDTAVIAGATYTYQVTGADNAGNISAASSAASITIPSSGTPSSLLAFLENLPGQTKHILVGQHADYFSSNAQQLDCVPANNNTAFSGATAGTGGSSGKSVAILGTSNFFLNSDNVSSSPTATFVQNTNAWLAQGGIVQVTQCPLNPNAQTCSSSGVISAGGGSGNAPAIWTPGSPANTTWLNFLNNYAIKLLNQVKGTVLWRPIPECNGNHFGAKLDPNGPFTTLNAQYNVSLFQYTHDYCMGLLSGQPLPAGLKPLSNVLWMLNLNYWDPNDFAPAYYPNNPAPASGSPGGPFYQPINGQNYVDVVSLDSYPPDANSGNVYNFYLTTGKPIIFAEAGYTGNAVANGGNNDTMLNNLKPLFPKVCAVVVWCQQWALPQQGGESAFMTDANVLTLSDLPAGI